MCMARFIYDERDREKEDNFQSNMLGLREMNACFEREKEEVAKPEGGEKGGRKKGHMLVS